MDGQPPLPSDITATPWNIACHSKSWGKAVKSDSRVGSCMNYSSWCRNMPQTEPQSLAEKSMLTCDPAPIPTWGPGIIKKGCSHTKKKIPRQHSLVLAPAAASLPFSKQNWLNHRITTALRGSVKWLGYWSLHWQIVICFSSVLFTLITRQDLIHTSI